jgi:hypothetical protein
MTVRRTKPSDAIAALHVERIEITPSGDGVDPGEAGALRDIAAKMNRVAIGPSWLAEQERAAEKILKNSEAPSLDDLRADRGDGITYGIEFYPAGSAAWYASSIKGHIAHLQRLLNGTKPDGSFAGADGDWSDEEFRWLVIDAAMRLASVWTEAKINGAFRKPLATGLKQTARLAENSKEVNERRQRLAAEQHAQWQAKAGYVWERNGRLSTSRCAKIVIEKLGLSKDVKTVADQIRSLRPRKVGNAR